MSTVRRQGLSWTGATSIWAALFALGGIAAFRVAALAFNATDLNVDEAQYWTWSRELDFGYYSKPPLIAWIIAAVTPLCGDGEACVRLPAVLLHLFTSLVIYRVGARLYSAEVGFWSAITFATLPGISVSSGIISTDVSLLLAWSVGLLAFVELLAAPSIAMALLLGAALGLGLNAKYAMAYFIPCAALFLLAVRGGRTQSLGPYLAMSGLVAAVLLAPNLLWNSANGLATFAHTADNANWAGSLFHPDKALEFLAAQFGVFGPVLMGALLVIVGRAWGARLSGRPAGLSESDLLLLSFSVPIIALLTVQGFLSRSLANWAAPAYVAGTLLVVASLLRSGASRWLTRSLILHAGVAIAIALATANAGSIFIPGGDPFARTLGWRQLASDIDAGVKADQARDVRFGTILADDRDVLAALLYYGRDTDLPVRAWRAEAGARNHFELKRPFDATAAEPVLLISRRRDGSGIPSRFSHVIELGPLAVAAGDYSERMYHLFELAGYKGE